jgi:hypothetical protein
MFEKSSIRSTAAVAFSYLAKVEIEPRTCPIISDHFGQIVSSTETGHFPQIGGPTELTEMLHIVPLRCRSRLSQSASTFVFKTCVTVFSREIHPPLKIEAFKTSHIEIKVPSPIPDPAFLALL